MHTTPTVPAATKAFTLVELLTVIAIIGILAAILIPTVAAVRSAAHQATCTSNLRQIAMGVLAYANDHRGQLPAGRNSSGEFIGLRRGLGDPNALASGKTSGSVNVTTDQGTRLAGHIARYLGTSRANYWRCPGNNAAWDATSTGTTYICNNQSSTVPSYFFGRADTNGGIPGSAEATPKNINQSLMSGTATQVSEPSRLWMLSDADSFNYSSEGMPAIGAPNEVPLPHRGARNYAFFDGHVESRRINDLPANP